MRLAMSAGVLALFALSTPASAQMMCAPGQQAQASTPGMGAMMCGAPSGAATTMEMPSTDQLAQKSSGMCPCCRNMAMMKGKPGGMQHNMPGMEMPQ